MKLTTAQLKQIIKEELLKEADLGNYAAILQRKTPWAFTLQTPSDRSLEARLEGLAADALEDFRIAVKDNAIDSGQDEVDAEDLARDSVEKLFAEYMVRNYGHAR